ncbi:MAG: peptidoglycan-binding protein [Actinomycetota bacterium]|nr:peptidoglycan-binding protein [Actinomycetota bacterium]
MTFAAWEAADRCTGGPASGARALMAGCLDAFGARGATNLGIYNCRTVRGAATTSCHGEGRACDIGFPLHHGRANPAGQELVDRLRPFAGRLGLQAIIFDRRIYSAKSPSGRAYTGVAPHLDHLHIELTRAAAQRLTLATVRLALAGEVRGDGVPLQRSGGTGGGRPRLSLGSSGADVALVQRFLGVRADGLFGDKTAAAVRRYQRLRGLVPDGVVGPRTWAPILAALRLE